MKLEERLTRSLHDGLAQVDAPAGDLSAVRRTGTRLRRRRRVAAGAAALAAVVAGVATVSWDRGDDGQAPDPAGSGDWRRLDDAPIAGRAQALAGWTGEEVLFIGGDLEPCPSAAMCDKVSPAARDGAAFDPDTGTWRVISQAPAPMGYYFRTTMVGDTMVISGNYKWWAYDASDDSWSRLPDPPVRTEDTGSISSADGLVYAMSEQARVQVLDLAALTWSELPAPQRRFGGAVVATDDGVVVSSPGSLDPAEVTVQVWDGSTWSEVSAPQQSPFRHWTGERLVELDPQRVDDEGTRAGGILDPATGEWSPLPHDLTASAGTGWSLNASAGPLMLGWGYLYDDRDGSWTRQAPKPDDAAGAGVSAVWADGRVVVFGGVDDSGGGYDPVSQAWLWEP